MNDKIALARQKAAESQKALGIKPRKPRKNSPDFSKIGKFVRVDK